MELQNLRVLLDRAAGVQGHKVSIGIYGLGGIYVDGRSFERLDQAIKHITELGIKKEVAHVNVSR